MLPWETAEETRSDPADLEFAPMWRDIPKVVFSTTLQQVRGNARLAVGDVAGEAARLVSQPGDGVVSVGGAGLASTLIKLDLIEEYRLFVHPVVLGGGTPYFPPLDRAIELELLETRTFGSRVVYLRYRRGVAELAIVARLRAAGCVFAEDEARLLMATARTPEELDAMVERRAAGLPLEQVLGWAEFCGLRIAVDPGVFVPRRRTEFLVQQAVRCSGPPGLARPEPSSSTCAAARARSAPRSPRPWTTPRCTPPTSTRPPCAAPGGTSPGHVYQGDLYQPLPARLRGQVAILAANVPYVPTGEIGFLPPEARAHEPLVALDGGPDGLDVLRRVAAGAPDWLAPGGHLLIETSDRQAPLAAAAFEATGLTPRVASDEDLNATVLIGTLGARPV